MWAIQTLMAVAVVVLFVGLRYVLLGFLIMPHTLANMSIDVRGFNEGWPQLVL
jgi:hypothetical protein